MNAVNLSEFNTLSSAFFSFLIGTCLGSFASAWAVRYLKNQSIVLPASACDWCQTPLLWWMKIPVLSFIILRGKTSCCHVSIPRIYWVNEMLMGIFTLKVWLTLSGHPHALFLITQHLLLGFVLLLVSTTDLICRIIPNRFLVGGIIGNFVLLILTQNFSALWNSAIGLCAGYLSLWAVSLIYELLRKKEGMGGGDIKLFAFLGCFLGVTSLPFIIFYASFIAVLFFGCTLSFQKKFSLSSEIPFGPFLSLAAIVYMFWGALILNFV